MSNIARMSALAALGTACLAVGSATTAMAKECKWFGTRPICDGQCPPGWTYTGKRESCVTGSRRFCCKGNDAVGTSAGPEVPFKGCIAFQHMDFKGAKFNFKGNVNVSYVGSNWNDKISSFSCAIGCQITIFEHRDFKGASATFGAAQSYVGSTWNDRISSLRVRCS